MSTGVLPLLLLLPPLLWWAKIFLNINIHFWGT
jgi:hypothetical protein